MRRTVLFLLALSALGSPALAAEPKSVATYRDWTVFTRDVGGDLICYAVAEAREKQPKSVNHGDVFMLVSTWRSGAAIEQPSFMTAGYDMKDGSAPTAKVGSDDWPMFVAGNEAFIESDGQEKALVSAMKRGSELRVSATSKRGTRTNYEISLLGITKALEAARKACS
ncbi:MAG: invasion associated locus B family protein [Pseudomonadota bacterium]